MRDAFFGYYPPTKDEYERLWAQALIVLDTNVLLDLYRLPKEARDEFFDVLDALKERLWLPYQVALEFQRRRLTVIAAERKATEAALELAGNFVSQVSEKVNSLQMEKHALGLDPKPLLKDLENANSKVVEAIQAVHSSQLDIAATDPVRERVDEIIKERIGPAPSTQADLDGLVQNGDERYAGKIPPGFSDAAKERNPNEAEFVHDGLSYQRKFGDLILWRQLLDFTKTNSLSNIIFVTSDKKDDWWWREQGKTVGPHPELIREIRRESGVELFWMYSSDQFLEHAAKFTKTKVSKKSVADLQGLLSESNLRRFLTRPDDIQSFYSSASYIRHEECDAAVRDWLETMFGDTVITGEGFPDLVVKTPAGLHGYEIKYVRNFDNFLFPPSAVSSLLRGYLEVNEGRLWLFSLVVVIPQNTYQAIFEENRLDELRSRMNKLLKKYPVHAIIVGTIDPDGHFVPLAHRSPHSPKALGE